MGIDGIYSRLRPPSYQSTSGSNLSSFRKHIRIRSKDPRTPRTPRASRTSRTPNPSNSSPRTPNSSNLSNTKLFEPVEPSNPEPRAPPTSQTLDILSPKPFPRDYHQCPPYDRPNQQCPSREAKPASREFQSLQKQNHGLFHDSLWEYQGSKSYWIMQSVSPDSPCCFSCH